MTVNRLEAVRNLTKDRMTATTIHLGTSMILNEENHQTVLTRDGHAAAIAAILRVTEVIATTSINFMKAVGKIKTNKVQRHNATQFALTLSVKAATNL